MACLGVNSLAPSPATEGGSEAGFFQVRWCGWTDFWEGRKRRTSPWREAKATGSAKVLDTTPCQLSCGKKEKGTQRAEEVLLSHLPVPSVPGLGHRNRSDCISVARDFLCVCQTHGGFGCNVLHFNKVFPPPEKKQLRLWMCMTVNDGDGRSSRLCSAPNQPVLV